MNDRASTLRRTVPVHTPSSLGTEAARDISGALNMLRAQFIALYVKTKNCRWQASGPHFCDYRPMLDEHANQIYATMDPIAERERVLGATTFGSIGHIGRLECVSANNAEYATPLDILAELGEDNGRLADRMRETRAMCDEYRDLATASLLELWIAEAEWRAWFLFEVARHGQDSGTLGVAAVTRSIVEPSCNPKTAKCIHYD